MKFRKICFCQRSRILRHCSRNTCLSFYLAELCAHIARYATLTQRNCNDRVSADTGKSAINSHVGCPVSALCRCRAIAAKSLTLSATIAVITEQKQKQIKYLILYLKYFMHILEEALD